MAESIRIRDDVVYRELDGEIVALSLESGAYVGFDDIGSEIWRLIERHGSLEAIKADLLERYDLTDEACQAELEAFLQSLLDKGLITRCESR